LHDACCCCRCLPVVVPLAISLLLGSFFIGTHSYSAAADVAARPRTHHTHSFV
jgi:hypothetical protein